MVYRGYRVDEKPRCECGGFLPENYTKTVCPNCGKANRRFTAKTKAQET